MLELILLVKRENFHIMEIDQVATNGREGACHDRENQMEIELSGDELQRLAEDALFVGNWSKPIAKAYRKRLQQIIAAQDERDLRFPGGNHFERLQGDRNHQHSMRLNDQWRLIMEIRRDGTKTIVRIVGIEDYH